MIKNVTIAGGGVLGSQISWQTAFHGFSVTVLDQEEKGLTICKNFHKNYGALFEYQRGATKQQVAETYSRLHYTTDMEEAVKNADLISESIPENVDIKRGFYEKLGVTAPEKTIFTTNTSTLLPSEFADSTGRPEKFLALHFANGIWDANIAEIMAHDKTDKATFEKTVEFAQNIGMVPVPIKKEHNGYVLNTLLVPWLNAATDLLMGDVTDHESVDKTWMISTGSPMGPFGWLDMIGMETAYNISKLWGDLLRDEARLAKAAFIKEEFIDKGRLGTKNGKGFYNYPNPAFQDPDFLK